MNDDGQGYSAVNVDQELEAAIHTLKQLPQTERAAGVGITVRRYREIERGRVAKPHKSTREAIMRFADTIRTGGCTLAENTRPNAAASVTQAEQDEGSFPYGAAAIFAFFLICIFARIFAGRNTQIFTLPMPPITPNEE